MKMLFRPSKHPIVGTFSMENQDHHLLMFYVLNSGTVAMTDATDDTINDEEISYELRENEVFQIPEGFGFSGVKYECRRVKNKITAIDIWLVETVSEEDS